jgi:hypothetical protein
LPAALARSRAPQKALAQYLLYHGMLNTDALLDLLAAALSSRLSIFGLRGRRYLRITPRRLATGRFTGGATRFVDAEGVVFTELKVRRAA